MARLRLQFSLKWLIVFALSCGPLLGLYGIHVKSQRAESELEFSSKDMEKVLREWERIWESDDPEQHKRFTTEHGDVI
jgi:hypothetical protein